MVSAVGLSVGIRLASPCLWLPAPWDFAMSTPSFQTKLFPILLDVKPVSPAFLCSSIEDYHHAVRVFSNKWIQRQASPGKWNHWTLKTFHNLVVALMKLKNFGEAEKHCRKVLQESLEDNKAESDDHCCTQCTLATCLYLSAQHREAEALFRQIRRHDEMLARYPARDFYQTLCLTR